MDKKCSVENCLNLGAYHTKTWRRDKCNKHRGKHKWGSKRRKGRRARLLSRFDPFVCARCGFVPEHPAQMDVDHADGNRYNQKTENLVLLCPNCHRLKTLINKDFLNKYENKA